MINLTNDKGKVDGVLRLPHKGTTSEPKIIAVTSDIPDSSKFVTISGDQVIYGKKTFIDTLKAFRLTDGKTTKTMTEVLAGGGGSGGSGGEIFVGTSVNSKSE